MRGVLQMKWICKLFGHVFGGYEVPKDKSGNAIQAMPDKFFCLRCKYVNSTYEGWN